MAKVRTKKQKIRATYHYAFPAERSFRKAESVSVETVESLYQYDPKYTRSDLARTFLTTALMIVIEIGIYIFL